MGLMRQGSVHRRSFAMIQNVPLVMASVLVNRRRVGKPGHCTTQNHVGTEAPGTRSTILRVLNLDHDTLDQLLADISTCILPTPTPELCRCYALREANRPVVAAHRSR